MLDKQIVSQSLITAYQMINFSTESPPIYVRPRFYRILAKKKTLIQVRISVYFLMLAHVQRILHKVLVKFGFQSLVAHRILDLPQMNLD